MITLCLIHGWASNVHIFDRLRHHLPNDWQIITPNLPGHGDRLAQETFNLTTLSDEIAPMLPDNAFVFGWSLGGLVAQDIAWRYPNKVRGLILCATFAKLYATEDYPEGLNNRMLDKMLHLFEQDYPKYMAQFLQMQLLHSTLANEILSAVLPDAIKHGTPQGMRQALSVIAQADMRPHLADIHCPTLLIYGNKDAITPPRMGEYLAQHLPHATFQCIDKAAHTPFLSHVDKVSNNLCVFISQHQ